MTPFESYWNAVPIKVKKKVAAEVWKRKKLDAKIDLILADIEQRKRADDRWLRGFIPDPPTYLRQERWGDEIVKPHKPAAATPAAQRLFERHSITRIDPVAARAAVALAKSIIK